MGDGDHDCLTNLRFADDVLLQNVAQKRWDSRYIQEKRRFLAAKARRVKNEIDNIKVDICTREERSNGYIPATGDDQDQKSYQGCLGDVLQIQTRNDFEIVPSSTSASLIRHGGRANDELRIRNMDTLKRTPRI